MKQSEDTAKQREQAGFSRRNFLCQGAAAVAGLYVRPGALFAAKGEAAVVSTPSGKLSGELVDGVRVFRGVPFATPPVGSLRFRATEALKPWQGVRDATRFSAAPVQPDQPNLAQSEDCLYLNIWAPPSGGPWPVMVWIHGGGFTGGHSFSGVFDGTDFAKQGIVLVTVAYRLGVFGFMDLEPLLGATYLDSGNNALRDLVASLDWVNKNIGAFGGDPRRVTVGGESAGAKATAALLALPQANRLFESAISESGGGERVLTQAQAAGVSHTFGELWREGHKVPSPGFNDLLTAAPNALIATQMRVIGETKLHFPFRSEIGGAFLPKRPVDLVAAASLKGKRLLIGTNRDESSAFIGPHPNADPTGKDLGNLDLNRFDDVFGRYRGVYPEMTMEQLRVRAVTAEEYWVPSVRLADAFTHAGGRTWMYRLDYAKPSGFLAGQSFHALDVGLVWQKLDGVEAADTSAVRLSGQMHQSWVAFIKGLEPGAPLLPRWSQYDAKKRATMILAGQSRIEDRPCQAELDLWNGIL